VQLTRASAGARRGADLVIGWIKRRRWVAAAIAAALVAVGAAAIAVSTHVAPIATVSRFVAGTPEPSGLRVELDTTLYLPAQTPAPAILLAHGFGGTKASVDTEAKSLARHGYVVLAYTARGFGRSGGLIHLDAPGYEVADASKLVSYLATLPQVTKDGPGDPRVGVAGSSYGGGLALLLAGYDHRVDAVAADITWNNLSHALFPNAATDPASESDGVFKKLWAGELFQSGSAATSISSVTSPSTSAGGDPPPVGATTGCGRFAADVCSAYQQAASTGEQDGAIQALLTASSPATILSKIKAPVLLTQGEQDSLFPLTEADANARGIAATGTAVRVMWRAGGHDGGTSTSELVRDVTSWFDPILLHGVHPSTRQPFSLALVGSAISAATGRTENQTLLVAGYPGVDASAAKNQIVSVSGPEQTISAPAGGAPAAVTDVPELGDVLAQLASVAGSVGNISSVSGQFAAFASPRLSSQLLIAGAPTVTLSVTPTMTTDATLFVSLQDVSSDGSEVLPNSLVAPLQLTGLTPGTARTVTVRLPAIAYQVPAGHRLVLSVATTDLAYALPSDPRTYTIALAGGSTSITVPTVDGRVVRAGQPAAWLIVGLVAMGLAIAIGAARSWRLRRSAAVDRSLIDVPVAITGLVKRYGDGYRAVDNVSFRVEAGQVVGLLGPNGAGKTTTLRVLMGLIHPTEGEVRVFGERIVPGASVLARVGAFVEGPGFLPHLSGRDNLRLYWAATGRPPADADFETALDIAGLGASVDRRVKSYSHGMRQRLAIAQAMLGLPELLVLDEPTNGLDPPQIAEMREVLQRYAQTGRTVVISSHLLAEVEQTCTHVVVMHKGRLVAAGSVVEIAGGGGLQLAVDDADRAMAVLTSAGIASHAVPARRALEDVFLDLVGGANE
jgi:ABC-2 type transport system ATP-binding protein